MDRRAGGGVERDIWVVVDEDGRQAYFQLVEVEDARDVVRSAGSPQVPLVMIDVVVPDTRRLEARPAARVGSPRATLVVLRLHRATDGDTLGSAATTRRTAERLATFEWRMPSRNEEGTS